MSMKKIVSVIFILFLISCSQKSRISTIEVIYTNGETDTIKIKSWDSEFYLDSGDLMNSHESYSIISGVRSYRILNVVNLKE